MSNCPTCGGSGIVELYDVNGISIPMNCETCSGKESAVPKHSFTTLDELAVLDAGHASFYAFQNREQIRACGQLLVDNTHLALLASFDENGAPKLGIGELLFARVEAYGRAISLRAATEQIVDLTATISTGRTAEGVLLNYSKLTAQIERLRELWSVFSKLDYN